MLRLAALLTVLVSASTHAATLKVNGATMTLALDGGSTARFSSSSGQLVIDVGAGFTVVPDTYSNTVLGYESAQVATGSLLGINTITINGGPGATLTIDVASASLIPGLNVSVPATIARALTASGDLIFGQPVTLAGSVTAGDAADLRMQGAVTLTADVSLEAPDSLLSTGQVLINNTVDSAAADDPHSLIIDAHRIVMSLGAGASAPLADVTLSGADVAVGQVWDITGTFDATQAALFHVTGWSINAEEIHLASLVGIAQISLRAEIVTATGDLSATGAIGLYGDNVSVGGDVSTTRLGLNTFDVTRSIGLGDGAPGDTVFATKLLRSEVSGLIIGSPPNTGAITAAAVTIPSLSDLVEIYTAGAIDLSLAELGDARVGQHVIEGSQIIVGRERAASITLRPIAGGSLTQTGPMDTGRLSIDGGDARLENKANTIDLVNADLTGFLFLNETNGHLLTLERVRARLLAVNDVDAAGPVVVQQGTDAGVVLTADGEHLGIYGRANAEVPAAIRVDDVIDTSAAFDSAGGIALLALRLDDTPSLVVLDDGARLVQDQVGSYTRIETDTLQMAPEARVNSVGNLEMNTSAPDRPVVLGGATPDAGALSLSQAMLGQLVGFSRLNFNNEGPSHLRGDISYPGATLGFSAATSLDADVTVDVVSLSAPMLDVGLHHLTLNGDLYILQGLAFQADGLAPGEHGSISANGAVGVGGPLTPTLGVAPATGDALVVIDNDAEELVDGTFTGLPAGAPIGQTSWRMSYNITGNDVGFVAVAPASPADDSVTTAEDTAVLVDVLDNDEGDVTLAVSTVTDPPHGSAVVEDDGVRYLPDANYHGADTFTYTACDAVEQCATANVAVTVTPVNDAPTAVADQVSTNEETTARIPVVMNDSDVDGDSFSIASHTDPFPDGTVTIDGGELVFVPAVDATGEVTFTYAIRDTGGLESSATVTVTVVPDLDDDDDGLADTDEATLGTDKDDADSDDDGVNDGDEVDNDLDPNDPDSDDDGLSDGIELGHTDPLNPDSDGGGVLDGIEDANHNGQVDEGERDPNDASDDLRGHVIGGGCTSGPTDASLILALLALLALLRSRTRSLPFALVLLAPFAFATEADAATLTRSGNALTLALDNNASATFTSSGGQLVIDVGSGFVVQPDAAAFALGFETGQVSNGSLLTITSVVVTGGPGATLILDLTSSTLVPTLTVSVPARVTRELTVTGDLTFNQVVTLEASITAGAGKDLRVPVQAVLDADVRFEVGDTALADGRIIINGAIDSSAPDDPRSLVLEATSIQALGAVGASTPLFDVTLEGEQVRVGGDWTMTGALDTSAAPALTTTTWTPTAETMALGGLTATGFVELSARTIAIAGDVASPSTTLEADSLTVAGQVSGASMLLFPRDPARSIGLGDAASGDTVYDTRLLSSQVTTLGVGSDAQLGPITLGAMTLAAGHNAIGLNTHGDIDLSAGTVGNGPTNVSVHAANLLLGPMSVADFRLALSGTLTQSAPIDVEHLAGFIVGGMTLTLDNHIDRLRIDQSASVFVQEAAGHPLIIEVIRADSVSINRSDIRGPVIVAPSSFVDEPGFEGGIFTTGPVVIHVQANAENPVALSIDNVINPGSSPLSDIQIDTQTFEGAPSSIELGPNARLEVANASNYIAITVDTLTMAPEARLTGTGVLSLLALSAERDLAIGGAAPDPLALSITEAMLGQFEGFSLLTLTARRINRLLGDVTWPAAGIQLIGPSVVEADVALTGLSVAFAGLDLGLHHLTIKGPTTLNQRLAFQADGLAPGEHGLLSLVGTAKIDNVALVATTTFTPALGDVLVVIDNDGEEPVTGTFKDLPPGAPIGETPWRVSYDLTGNDVGLVVVAPPSSSDDDVTTAEDMAVLVDVLDNDTADGALALTAVTDPPHGTAAVEDGQVRYTPDADYHGADTFTYTACDAISQCATATVAVTVTAVNDAPTAVDDAATTNEESPIVLSVLANDSDVDGDALVIASHTDPRPSGTVELDGATLVFTPAVDATGEVTFSYTIRDSAGLESSATVTITVVPDPDDGDDVAPDSDEDTLGTDNDASEGRHNDAESSGCAAGGSDLGLAFAALVLLALSRKKTRALVLALLALGGSAHAATLTRSGNALTLALDNDCAATLSSSSGALVIDVGAGFTVEPDAAALVLGFDNARVSSGSLLTITSLVVTGGPGATVTLDVASATLIPTLTVSVPATVTRELTVTGDLSFNGGVTVDGSLTAGDGKDLRLPLGAVLLSDVTFQVDDTLLDDGRILINGPLDSASSADPRSLVLDATVVRALYLAGQNGVLGDVTVVGEEVRFASSWRLSGTFDASAVALVTSAAWDIRAATMKFTSLMSDNGLGLEADDATITGDLSAPSLACLTNTLTVGGNVTATDLQLRPLDLTRSVGLGDGATGDTVFATKLISVDTDRFTVGDSGLTGSITLAAVALPGNGGTIELRTQSAIDTTLGSVGDDTTDLVLIGNTIAMGAVAADELRLLPTSAASQTAALDVTTLFAGGGDFILGVPNHVDRVRVDGADVFTLQEALGQPLVVERIRATFDVTINPILAQGPIAVEGGADGGIVSTTGSIYLRGQANATMPIGLSVDNVLDTRGSNLGNIQLESLPLDGVPSVIVLGAAAALTSDNLIGTTRITGDTLTMAPEATVSGVGPLVVSTVAADRDIHLGADAPDDQSLSLSAAQLAMLGTFRNSQFEATGVTRLFGDVSLPDQIQVSFGERSAAETDVTITAPIVYFGDLDLGLHTVSAVGNITVQHLLAFQADGLGPGEHGVLAVTGAFKLTDTILVPSSTIAPQAGDVLLIVDNDGEDPVTGTFRDLPAGTPIGETPWRISYDITGNDIGFVVVTPPSAGDDDVTTAEDTAVLVDVLDNDTAEGELELTTVTDPPHGAAAVEDGQVRYAPDADYHGADTFTYTTCDAIPQCSTATVSVTVTSVNDAPLAVDDAVTTNEESLVVIPVLANDSDIDQDALVIASNTDPHPSGTVAIDGNTLVFTPAADVTGEVTFDYRVRDVGGLESTAEVTVTIQPDLDDDDDGLADTDEATRGTDKDDKDSDDDGVFDGFEVDHDLDPNDPDSDDDGLFDGTELGIGEASTDTDPSVFVGDQDTTSTTDPLNPDSDGGGSLDGDEDANHDGRVDDGERDPNDARDDLQGEVIGGGCAVGADPSWLFLLVLLSRRSRARRTSAAGR